MKAKETHRFDVRIKGVHVRKYIDASVGKGIHAAVVVCRGINMIDTDAVDSKIGHDLDIELALVRVDQRVGGGELVGDP